MHRALKNAATRLLPKSQFVRNVGVLAGGTASSQLLMIIAAPFLTRLFTPEDFGILGVYSGLLTLFAVVASLRYEFAILIPEDDEDAINLVFLSLGIVLCTVIFSAICVFFWGGAVTTSLNAPKLLPYLWLLPVGVLFLGSYKVLNHWALRKKNFREIAKTKVKQSVATLLIQLGAYAAGPVALIAGQALGQGVGSLSLADPALKSALRRKRKISTLLQLASRYRAFPLYSSWSSILDTVGRQASVLIMVAYFSPAAAGLYLLSYKVLAVPIVVAGTAIGHVFMSAITSANQDGRLGIITEKINERLANLALPPMLTLALIAPTFFEWVFGVEWRQAGEFAQWMAPWLFAVFITLPLTTLFEVTEKQTYNLAFKAALCLSQISTVSLGAYLDSIQATIIMFSIGNAACWVTYLWWINKDIGNSFYSLARTTGSALLWALLCNIPLILGILFKINVQNIILCLLATGLFVSLRCSIILKKLL